MKHKEYRARWLWRIIALFGLSLAVIGFATSQAWRVPDVPDLRPAWEMDFPEIAEHLPDNEAISSAFGTPTVRYSDSPPQLLAFLSNAPMAKELRQRAYSDSWERQWNALDDSIMINIRLFETLRADFSVDPQSCQGTEELNLGSQRVGYKGSGTQYATEYCASEDQGRMRIRILLEIRHYAVDGYDAEEILTAVLDSIEVPAESYVDVTGNTVESVWRPAILRGWILAVPLLTAIAIVPAFLRDRATWQRFFSIFRQKYLPPGAVDVSPLAELARARLQAFGSLRLAALIWTVRATEIFSFTTLRSWAALILVYVLSLVIERRLLLRWAPRRAVPIFTGARRWWAVGGIAASLLVMLGAAWLWQVGATAQAAGVSQEFREWELARTGHLLQIGGALVLLFSFLPLSVARRLAMRRSTAHEKDPRPPILFLRSFVDDVVTLRSHRMDRANLIDQIAMRTRERFEEVIATSLSRMGPVLAIGTPGEKLPPDLGAARVHFSDDQWQDAVLEISHKSSYVVMTLGRSESLVWEMHRLREQGLLSKTIFMIPPLKWSEVERRLNTLVETYGLQPHLTAFLGDSRTPLAVCMVPGQPTPTVFWSRGADDLSYEAAIAQAASLVRNAPAGAPLPVGKDFAQAPTFMQPKGKAKPHVSHLRKSIKNNVFEWMVITAVPIYIAGGLWGFLLTGEDVEYDPSLAPTHILGGSSGSTKVVFNNSIIADVNFNSRTVEPIIELEENIDEALLANELILVTGQETGSVSAYSVTTGAQQWSTLVADRVRGISTIDGSVYTTSPGEEALYQLNLQSGELENQADLGGAPWDVVAIDGFILVPLINRDEVVGLHASDLEEINRFETDPSPSQVEDVMGWPMVVSRVTNVATATYSDPARHFFLATTLSEITGDGALPVATGYERITDFGRTPRWSSSPIRFDTYTRIPGPAIGRVDDGIVFRDGDVLRFVR